MSAGTTDTAAYRHPLRSIRRWLATSVSHRITASTLALALTMTAAAGGASYSITRQLMENEASRQLAAEAVLAARQTEAVLDLVHADVSRLASNGLLAQALAESERRAGQLAAFFRNYRGPAGLAASLSLHDRWGRPLIGTGDRTPPSYEGAPWLQRVTKLGLPHVEISRGGREPTLLVARPVPYESETASAGMLVIESPIGEIFRRAMSSVTSDLVKRLKTGRGEVLAEASVRRLAEPVAATEPVMPDGVYPVDLRLEVAGERGEILEPLRLLTAAYAVAAGLALLILLRVSRFLGMRLTRELRQMSAALAPLAGATAPLPQLPMNGQDEIARIAVAFNALARRVGELDREREERGPYTAVTAQDINSALVKEILSHKRTGEQLQVAANAIAHAAEGVMICDAQERILSVNKSFTQITGYAPEEVLGKTPADIADREHNSELLAEISRIAAEHGRWKGELWNRRKDGESYLEERSVSAVRDDEGRLVNYIILFSDVTKRRQDEQRLHFLAHHDPLTGLPNRALFQQRCDEALLRLSRRNARAAMMFIDIDHFKNVNDSLGHGYGDDLLKNVSSRIQECVRKTDIVARLGGDEFTILLNEVGDTGDVALIARKLLDRLSGSFAVAGHTIYVSASMGISVYPDDGDSAAVLIRNADAAMFAAKEQGRNNYQFFSSEMNAQALETLMMASSLKLAVERGELALEYQPRIDLTGSRVIGVEALVRWNHPTLGRIMPGQFIGIAEKTGLINPIGEWVLREACRQAVEWRRSGFPHLRVAVNLSARQFNQPDLTDRVAAILAETGLDPRALELEVTESMVMRDPQRAAVILERFREMGVAVAIDDFGTGYSSLSYLKRFPIDYIKIDQSFIRGVPHDAEDTGITSAVIAMAKTLGLKLIAEGVDNHDQLAFLRREGCNEGQGYFISTPIPGDAVQSFIRDFARSAGKPPGPPADG
jgi:diguanylate cyclase (GGDEF)-like protein/PAS domain S-box-containing protein